MSEEDLFRARLAPSTSIDIECGLIEGAQDSTEHVLCPRGSYTEWFGYDMVFSC
jgi:hypothetical protein